MQIRTDENCEFCKNVIEDLNHLLYTALIVLNIPDFSVWKNPECLKTDKNVMKGWGGYVGPFVR